jgi:hypothetical protein
MISVFGRLWKAAGAAGRTVAVERVTRAGPTHCNAVAAEQRPGGQLLWYRTAAVRTWDARGMHAL